MTEKSVGPGRMAYLETSFARVPMRRLIHVDEVADGFVFLASDESSAITGTELRVDGAGSPRTSTCSRRCLTSNAEAVRRSHASC
jgi:NAD(P)-dependent dehydrogenase (short-subunit alcohol dehydrogenase family)